MPNVLHPLARGPRTAALFAAAALAAASPLAGCYRPGRGGVQAAQPATTVRVQNQNFLDMTIYVLRNGTRVRLGLATGTSTARFTIPASLVQTLTPLRFVADPIGGRRTPISEEITVSPGDEVTLTLPPG